MLPPEPEPDMMLPVTLALPVTVNPVPVTTTMLAFPTALMLTLPLALGIFTLLFPLAMLAPPDAVIPVSCEPLPIKKLADKLPLASLSAIVFAVFADAGALPCNILAFKFDTNVVDVTTNGAVPVATVEISWPLTLAVVKLPFVALILPAVKLPTTLAVPAMLAPVEVTTN